MIALVGLEEKADDRAGKLSGGQQRRLDVGMALVGDPELLFLDEPTTGFDPSARRQAWDVIAGLRDLGKTVFLTTHYMDEAQRLADRVTIIAAGEIVARGTPEDLGDRESQPATIRYRADGEEVTRRDRDPVATLHELTGRALERGEDLEGLEVTRPTLEDVYIELTTPPGARPSERPGPGRPPVPLRPEGLLAQPGGGLLHGDVPGRAAADLRHVFGDKTVDVDGGDQGDHLLRAGDHHPLGDLGDDAEPGDDAGRSPARTAASSAAGARRCRPGSSSPAASATRSSSPC